MKLITFLETVFCKRFFYFNIQYFLIPVLFVSTACASVSHGQITTKQGKPVPFTYIKNISTGYVTYSDEQGYFSLSNNCQVNDSLQIQRIGYHTKFTILKQNNQTIILYPQNINLKTVTIEGEQKNFSGSNGELVKIEKSAAIKSINHRSIFSSIPGAYIKSYGGSAGLSTLSMDGAPTRHTKILISGFDITNTQNGQVDLSQLPQNFIENITYDPYIVSSFGNGGSEGAINISPWQESSSLYFGAGSFGKQEYGLTFSHQLSSFHLNLMAGKSKDDGDYEGYNPVTDNYQVRKNNYLERQYLSFRLQGVITKNLFGKLLYLYSDQNRGVAGQIWSPTPESYREDSFHLFGAKLGWVLNHGAGFFQTTIRNSQDHYFSSPNFGFPYNSNHTMNTLRFKLTQNLKLTDFLKYTVAITGNDDKLISRNTGNHTRLSWQFSNSLSLQFKNFEFIPEYHFDYADDLYSESTWNYTLRYTLDRWIFHSAAFNFGQHFYYPSFNDLYWQPGGNPKLNPEETAVSSLDLQFSLLQPQDFKILVFDKKSKNLIQWLPSQSYWLPKNIRQSSRRGIKSIYNFSFEKLPVSAIINYTYNFSKDVNGNSLLYSPRHSGSINLDLTMDNWQIHYQGHYTDERIARYSWPENVIIKPITEHTTGVSYTHVFKYGRLATSVLVENMTNVAYETIKGYPEPGRTFKIRLQFYLNNQKGIEK